MADFPALPVFTDAFLADTMHLSRDEIGAYMLLLFTAWRRPECDLPDDDVFLAKIVRCDQRKWRHLRPVMEQFHVIENGKWRQKRLQKERKYVDKHSKTQRDNVMHRWNKNKDLPDTTVIPKTYHGNTPTPTPIPKEQVSSSRAADEKEFQELFGLLSFDGNDAKNWIEFAAMKTRHGLDYQKHILPAAQHHKAAGKLGKTLSYIRPKAIEIRDTAAVAATSPVLFEPCHEMEWEGRMDWYFSVYEKRRAEYPDAIFARWPAKWGPIFTDPDTKVPKHIIAKFAPKLMEVSNAA